MMTVVGMETEAAVVCLQSSVEICFENIQFRERKRDSIQSEHKSLFLILRLNSVHCGGLSGMADRKVNAGTNLNIGTRVEMMQEPATLRYEHENGLESRTLK